MNLQGEKHVFFMGKTQLVPAGYVVTKNGLGGGVGVGPQQNRNSHMKMVVFLTPAYPYFYYFFYDFHSFSFFNLSTNFS